MLGTFMKEEKCLLRARSRRLLLEALSSTHNRYLSRSLSVCLRLLFLNIIESHMPFTTINLQFSFPLPEIFWETARFRRKCVKTFEAQWVICQSLLLLILLQRFDLSGRVHEEPHQQGQFTVKLIPHFYLENRLQFRERTYARKGGKL